MKKLIAVLGVLFACAQSDAMREGGFKDARRISDITQKKEDLVFIDEYGARRPIEPAIFYTRHGRAFLAFADGSNWDLTNGGVPYEDLYLLTIDSNVTNIEDSVFYGCDRLQKLSFGSHSTLRNIGRSAFSMTAISEVCIPNTVQIIGDCCFSRCSVLEVVKFEENSQLKRIGENAFKGCRLKEIVIPNSLEEIGDLCFDLGCKTSFKVYIDRNSQLKTVGNRVFPLCAEIYDLSGHVLSNPDFGFDPNPTTVMGRNLYWRGSRFLSKNGMELTIPKTIEKLDPYCCYGMLLDKVVFEAGSHLKKIGENAFSCSISEGITVYSRPLCDLLYQNLVATYGLEQSPQGRALSHNAPRLILRAAEKASAAE